MRKACNWPRVGWTCHFLADRVVPCTLDTETVGCSSATEPPLLDAGMGSGSVAILCLELSLMEDWDPTDLPESEIVKCFYNSSKLGEAQLNSSKLFMLQQRFVQLHEVTTFYIAQPSNINTKQISCDRKGNVRKKLRTCQVPHGMN